MALSQEKKGAIAVSLTNFLDSGCIVASGVALAAWAIAFNFDNVWVSILGAVGANAFGAAVGALIGGFLADRFGRKFIYTYNLLVYATGVFLIMCAVNLPMLCAGIVISGLSVGAGVPSSWSYISEMSSSTSRAANIGISQFAWSCGPAVIFLIALLFSFVFPTFGSDGALLPAGTYGPFDGLFAMRLLFLILFVVALIAWNLQRKLEESKDWTEKQDAAAGKRDTFIQMMGRALTNSVNVKSIVFLVAVYLTWNIVAGTMGQFMPYMYAAAGHLDDTTISLLQAVMWILTAVGSLAIFSKFGDKIPHRILFAATAVMALAAWVVMVFFGMQLEAGTADSWGWLLWVFVALWGISAGLLGPVLLCAVVDGAVPDAVSRRRAGHHVLFGARRAGHLVARGRGGPRRGNPCGLRDCRHHHVWLPSGVARGGRHLVPQHPGPHPRRDHRGALRQAHRLAARWARPLVERVLDSATFRNGPASSGPFS